MSVSLVGRIRQCLGHSHSLPLCRRLGSAVSTANGQHDHHDSQSEASYNEPTGYLFNRLPGESHPEDPVRNLFIFGYFGGLAAFAFLYYYKPDTSAEKAAYNEAVRRMKARGQDPELYRYSVPQMH